MTPTIRPTLLATVVTLALAAAAPADAPRLDLHGDPLPPLAVARLGTVRYRHPGSGIQGLGVVDNDTAVTLGEDRHVCLWHLASGKALGRYRTEAVYRGGFAVSADGKRLAIAAANRKQDGSPADTVVRVLDARTGAVVREFPRGAERRPGSALAFSPDGKLLASFSNDGVARVEEVATGVELLREKLPSDIVSKVAFSPDGKRIGLATGPNARQVFVWDWQAAQPPREVPAPPRGAFSLAFTADSKSLVTGDDGPKAIRFFDVATGKLQRTVGQTYQSDMHQIAVSPDGRYLASGSHRDGAVVVWDLATGTEVFRHAVGERGVGQPVFTPDSRHLVARGGGGVVEVWAVPSGKSLTARDGHRQSPSFVALLADGTAVTASDDGTARVWDAATGRQRRQLDVSGHWVRGAAVSPDGRRLATSSLGKDHGVRLYDVASGNLLYHLSGHGRSGGNRAVAFTADGNELLSYGDDRNLRRWAVGNGKAIDEIAIAPDGRKMPADDDWAEREMMFLFDRGVLLPGGAGLVVASGSHLYLFDPRTGKQIKKLPQGDGMITATAGTPDGKAVLLGTAGPPRTTKLPDGRLWTSREDRVVCLVGLATGLPLWRRVIPMPDAIVHWVAVRGRIYAVGLGATPARIEVGDLATGKVTRTIADVPAAVRSLAFSPDGKRVIAGLADTTAVVYDLDR